MESNVLGSEGSGSWLGDVDIKTVRHGRKLKQEKECKSIYFESIFI